MIRTVVLIAASLFATPIVAQEQVYIYVKYKDATGTSSRHQLDCIDLKCKASVQSEERSIALSEGQQKELLGALQAEINQFVVKADSASSDQLVKVKLRYDTPRKRLQVERRLPADKPAELTPEMIQVIKTHLELDLTNPVSPRPDSGDKPSSEPHANGNRK